MERDEKIEEIFNYNRLTIRLFHESINYIVFWSRGWLIFLSLSLSKDLLPLGDFRYSVKNVYVFLPKLEEKARSGSFKAPTCESARSFPCTLWIAAI